METAAATRKLTKVPGLAATEAALRLGFGPGAGDDAVPWDVVGQKLAELLRFLASAVQALVASLFAALGSLARVALPAAAAVAVLLVVCGCCAAARRRRRGPDGEEVQDLDDGPVVRYHGVYKGGIFSMHPNKPIVC